MRVDHAIHVRARFQDLGMDIDLVVARHPAVDFVAFDVDGDDVVGPHFLDADAGLRAGEAQPEDDEVIYKRLVPLPVAVRMILRGTIQDAKTIASVLWLDHISPTAGAKKSPKIASRVG